MRTEPDVIAGVTVAGASSSGAGWTCVRTATGNYTLAFPGVKRAAVSMTMINAPGFLFITSGQGTPTQTIVTNNPSNVASDTAISFTARVSR